MTETCGNLERNGEVMKLMKCSSLIACPDSGRRSEIESSPINSSLGLLPEFLRGHADYSRLPVECSGLINVKIDASPFCLAPKKQQKIS